MLYIKGMAKKATNIEIDRRIHKIYDLLLLGNSKNAKLLDTARRIIQLAYVKQKNIYHALAYYRNKMHS